MAARAVTRIATDTASRPVNSQARPRLPRRTRRWAAVSGAARVSARGFSLTTVLMASSSDAKLVPKFLSVKQ
jgi:hypothetical protein